MAVKLPYRNFFLKPQIPRQKLYEILRARFVDELPIKAIAKKFCFSFNTAQSQIRDFKNQFDEEQKQEFFIASKTGPKKERKKAKVRDDIFLLRARGYANTDIHKALKLADKEVSLSLIDQVLREKGLIGLRKRTREDRDRIEQELKNQQIPGFTFPVAVPEIPQVADVNELQLDADFKSYTRVAGIFLFLPFLVSAELPKLIEKANLPGSKMIPSISYFLSLLALK